MNRFLSALAGAALLATPVAAQDPHAGHGAPPPAEPAPADPHAGHGSPPPPSDPHAGHGTAPSAADPHAGHGASPAAEPAPADPHAGHGAAAPAADPHAGHAMPPEDPHAGHAAAETTGADLPVGTAPAPPAPEDDLADAIFGRSSMERARRVLRDEHGGSRNWQVMGSLAEARFGEGETGGAWDVEAWWGTDLHRLVVKSEGGLTAGEGVEEAEVQALYSRPVGRYTDLQVGVRHDFEPFGVTYAVVGFETLLPYWVEVEGAAFLSEDGDLSARVEGTYDLRITQRLVLQPRAELAFAASASPAAGVGSGFTDVEAGLRLRYEFRREFAPYVGVSWERRLGETADLARAAGEDSEEVRLVVGIQAWF